jgi:hypothetical protein
MLSRFMFIDEEGCLELRGNPKAIYATMVNIRSQIIINAGHCLR